MTRHLRRQRCSMNRSSGRLEFDLPFCTTPNLARARSRVCTHQRAPCMCCTRFPAEQPELKFLALVSTSLNERGEWKDVATVGCVHLNFCSCDMKMSRRRTSDLRRTSETDKSRYPPMVRGSKIEIWWRAALVRFSQSAETRLLSTRRLPPRSGSDSAV